MDNKEVRLTGSEKRQRDSVLKKMQAINATAEDSIRYYKWELLPVIYDRAKVDSLIGIINKGGLNPAMGGLMFQSLYKDGFDLSDKLTRFNKPVDIITGSQDPMAFISYEIKILLPKADMHWINKSGHFPMYERPEDFYNTLPKIIDAK